MTFDVSRLSNPLFVSENRLPARSDHRWFATDEEPATGGSSFETSLNGIWKFHYATNLAGAPEGFADPGYEVGTWDDIPVPAHIQSLGYDVPQYVNTQYPWDGYEDLEPGEVPTRFNPVASYVRTFTLSEPLAPGERLSVTFHGAETAIAVWLNGAYIGFATDSFTPSEFDLTGTVLEGENRLAAQVFKFSAAAWLEDQDFFRFSGLFRDVTLTRRPVVHVEDIDVRTTLTDDFAGARLDVALTLAGEGQVELRLDGVGELTRRGDGAWSIDVTGPRLWSSEAPHLYDLRIRVMDGSGDLIEVIDQRVGFRRFAIEDGLLKINGERIVFKGVNRHDFGLRGRVVSRAETEADIRTIKALGMNSVRTAHYPNNTYFYELCDKYGLYVIDEMNLETHGLWDTLELFDLGPDAAVPGDRPEWLPAIMDRATSMLERDKNHPSIVMWSCGNESYGGTNLLAVADYFRDRDTRPVHYEGVHWDPRYPRTTDVTSQMYTPAADVEAYLAEHRDKPFILCEFAHAMGNSFGAVDKYVDLAYREDLFQGMFIWDFADQAIPMTDRHGVEFFGYGGDNGEAPHDGDFCGNGILYADHSPKPFASEVQYLFQGFHTSISESEFTVTNRMLFTSTAAYDCVVTLKQEGRTLANAGVRTDVAPGRAATYPLPFGLPTSPGEYTVDVSYRLPAATDWAPAGHEMGWEQAVFIVAGGPAPTNAPTSSLAPRLVRSTHNIGVHGDGFSALFSRRLGGLTSYKFGSGGAGGRELLTSIPTPNFWHAPTSNERGWDAPATDGPWLLASRYATAATGADEPAVVEHEDSVTVTFTYTLPTSPVSTSQVGYRVFGDGRIEVACTVDPGAGLSDPPEFGMMFTVDPALSHLQFYGEGPAECYVDRRGGARLDVHSRDVRTALTPYLRPQEAGSHTQVRWARVSDGTGIGMQFRSTDPMEFSALPWTPFEIENATHPTRLPPIHHTVLRPALMRRGVGGDNTWGAQTHPEYRLPAGERLEFSFSFGGVYSPG